MNIVHNSQTREEANIKNVEEGGYILKSLAYLTYRSVCTYSGEDGSLVERFTDRPGLTTAYNPYTAFFYFQTKNFH